MADPATTHPDVPQALGELTPTPRPVPRSRVALAPLSKTPIFAIAGDLERCRPALSRLFGGDPAPIMDRQGRASTGRLLTLASHRWVWFEPSSTVSLIEAELGDAGLCIDLTDGLVGIRLFGPSAPEVLATGCDVDPFRKTGGADQAFEACFATLTVLVDRRTDGDWEGEPAPVFDLWVERSAAVWMWRTLEAAGIPYRMSRAEVDAKDQPR